MKAHARVLLIDDQQSVAGMLEALLKRFCAQLEYVADGAKGLQRARQERPDLIFLDIMMPGLDGFSVCRFLKDDPATRAIPVVFLSAAQDQDIARGQEVGADAFVGKPFVTGEIVAILQRFLSN